MFWYLLAIVVSSAICIVAFLITISGDFVKFQEAFCNSTPKLTPLPIVTPTGQIVNSVEELEEQISFLNAQYEDKRKDLEINNDKLKSALENLDKLTESINEVRKYYSKLKFETKRIENETTTLRDQIVEYKRVQLQLRNQVSDNVKYFTKLLNNMESMSYKNNAPVINFDGQNEAPLGIAQDEEYEIVKS